MKKLGRIFFIVIGGVVLLDAVAVSFISNPNTGLFLTYALGLLLLLLGVFFDKFIAKTPKPLKAALLAAVGAGAAFVIFLFAFGSIESVSYTEDAVIVLGAGVRGQVPSETLAKRLDAAISYHQKNPSALIVVSGGQGNGEDITEALAMERYLIDAGVSAEKIIKEERATSTHENFLYSKELLDAALGEGYSVAFITNDFHVARSSLAAERCGLGGATHAHSTTSLYFALPNSLRECLAIAKYLVFG